MLIFLVFVNYTLIVKLCPTVHRLHEVTEFLSAGLLRWERNSTLPGPIPITKQQESLNGSGVCCRHDQLQMIGEETWVIKQSSCFTNKLNTNFGMLNSKYNIQHLSIFTENINQFKIDLLVKQYV